jgi:ribonuclease HI
MFITKTNKTKNKTKVNGIENYFKIIKDEVDSAFKESAESRNKTIKENTDNKNKCKLEDKSTDTKCKPNETVGGNMILHSLPLMDPVNTVNVSTEISDKSKAIVIYTDGSCMNNGKKNAYGGVGIYCENTNESISQKIVYQTFNKPVTNNICEMYAIKLAIDKYEQGSHILKIVTDSQYCYNTFTKWAKSWKKNNWTKSTKGENLNLDMIKEIYAKCENQSVKFEHCNSHKSPPSNKSSNEYKIWFGNDMADKLASSAMKS